MGPNARVVVSPPLEIPLHWKSTASAMVDTDSDNGFTRIVAPDVVVVAAAAAAAVTRPCYEMEKIAYREGGFPRKMSPKGCLPQRLVQENTFLLFWSPPKQ